MKAKPKKPTRAEVRRLEREALMAAERLGVTPLVGEVHFDVDGTAWNEAYLGVMVAAEKLRAAKARAAK